MEVLFITLYSWLSDCCMQKKLLPLHRKYFLFLSDTTKKKLEEEIDEFSDSYYLDINITELKQILNNIDTVEDVKANEHYKKKFCPREEWVRFHGCCIYFHLPGQFLKYMNWEVPFELSIRRMKIEICMGGGSLAETLSHATHLVIVSSPEIDLDFEMLLNSFSETERRLFHCSRLQIVKSQWLVDCIEKNQKLPEAGYNLRPHDFQETPTGESNEQELARDEHQSLEIGTKDDSSCCRRGRKGNATPNKPRIVSLPEKVGKRRRGRPSGMSQTKGKSVVNLPRITRPRIGKKRAEICEYESDKDASAYDKEDIEVGSIDCGSSKMVDAKGNELDEGIMSEKQTINEDSEVRRANLGPSETSNLLIPNTRRKEEPKNFTSERGKAVERGASEHNNHGQRFDETNEVGTGQSSSIPYYDRLEENVDPVQAMLLNMLPILGTNKVENANPVPKEVTASAPGPVSEEENLPLNAETQPVKKRKVSYKDVAGELLKDW